jgi:hypothetical protein
MCADKCGAYTACPASKKNIFVESIFCRALFNCVTFHHRVDDIVAA